MSYQKGYKQFRRFLVIGVINTFVGYCFYSFFIYCGFAYQLAVLLSTILGVVFNYNTIKLVVFKSESNRIIAFALVYIALYSLNVIGIGLLDDFGVENKYMAGAALLIPLALLSFILNKLFVFKESR